jgi:hypothetical protein
MEELYPSHQLMQTQTSSHQDSYSDNGLLSSSESDLEQPWEEPQYIFPEISPFQEVSFPIEIQGAVPYY